LSLASLQQPAHDIQHEKPMDKKNAGPGISAFVRFLYDALQVGRLLRQVQRTSSKECIRVQALRSPNGDRNRQQLRRVPAAATAICCGSGAAQV
jgi:hypothetical protein